ncbi:MAG: hypothetical protein ACRBDI_06110 [Alphaproteobacteria bacterium]
MVTEIFYPRELKEAVADLRAKDDLNEKILFSTINANVLLYICLWMSSALLIFLLISDLTVAFVIILITALIFAVTCFYDIKNHIARILVYCNGEVRNGSVLSVSTYPGSGAFTAYAIIKDDETGKIIKLGVFVGWHKTKSFPVKNSKIKYFSVGDLPVQNMPCAKDIMDKYCLSLEFLKDFIYD